MPVSPFLCCLYHVCDYAGSSLFIGAATSRVRFSFPLFFPVETSLSRRLKALALYEFAQFVLLFLLFFLFSDHLTKVIICLTLLRPSEEERQGKRNSHVYSGTRKTPRRGNIIVSLSLRGKRSVDDEESCQFISAQTQRALPSKVSCTMFFFLES